MNLNYIEKQLTRYQSTLKAYEDISRYAMEKAESIQSHTEELMNQKDDASLEKCITLLSDALAYKDIVLELGERQKKLSKEFLVFKERARKDLDRMKK